MRTSNVWLLDRWVLLKCAFGLALHFLDLFDTSAHRAVPMSDWQEMCLDLEMSFVSLDRLDALISNVEDSRYFGLGRCVFLQSKVFDEEFS